MMELTFGHIPSLRFSQMKTPMDKVYTVLRADDVPQSITGQEDKVVFLSAFQGQIFERE